MTNIAVLLEPFPIRNTFSAYSWIGERLLEMLLADPAVRVALTDMRVVCNAPTMSQVIKRHPAGRPYVMQAPLAVQAPFLEAMSDWHTIGIHTWHAIQNGSPAHEAQYEAFLLSVREAYPFDVLAYWGTNETLRAVAVRLGIPMLWAEYGPLRDPFPVHLCLDPHGVNGLATGRDALRLKEAAEPSAMPAAALDLPVGGRTAYEATMLLPPADMAEPFSRLMRFVKNQDQVILLVMQLADDANVLTFGEGWTCKRLAETMLKLRAGPGTVFLLRPHPAEAHSFHNLVAGDAVRDALADRPDVLVFDDQGGAAYLACLSVATEVVCINSSVGFEAALLGKPVRVLGQASYMPPNGGADLTAPPVRLHDESIEDLLRDRYIPADRFWTVGCWRDKADSLAVPGPIRPAIPPPRLPTVATRSLGAAVVSKDGLLVVNGIGPLRLLPTAAQGCVDGVQAVKENATEFLCVQGWGIDPRTGGMLAGFLVTAGGQSVWSATPCLRPDVARAFKVPSRLATGFSVRLPQRDLSAAWSHKVEVFGVTVDGCCVRLDQAWHFDAATQGFMLHQHPVMAEHQ